MDFFLEAGQGTFSYTYRSAERAFQRTVGNALDLSLAPPLTTYVRVRPIEAAVALLPILEMVMANKIFASILSQEVSSISEKNNASSQQSSPAAFLTVISLSSYILAHASSAASPRALAYAGLSLKTLLSFLEASELTNALFNPCQYSIRLCRQVGLVPAM